MKKQKFTEGQKVWSWNWDGNPIYGTIHKNPYPISDWYIKYEDGEECAVLNENLVFAA